MDLQSILIQCLLVAYASGSFKIKDVVEFRGEGDGYFFGNYYILRPMDKLRLRLMVYPKEGLSIRWRVVDDKGAMIAHDFHNEPWLDAYDRNSLYSTLIKLTVPKNMRKMEWAWFDSNGNMAEKAYHQIDFIIDLHSDMKLEIHVPRHSRV